jgi:hypothetical protein
MLSIQTKLIHRRFSARAAIRPQHAIPLNGTMPTFDSTARKQIAPRPTFRNPRQGADVAICFV